MTDIEWNARNGPKPGAVKIIRKLLSTKFVARNLGRNEPPRKGIRNFAIG